MERPDLSYRMKILKLTVILLIGLVLTLCISGCIQSANQGSSGNSINGGGFHDLSTPEISQEFNLQEALDVLNQSENIRVPGLPKSIYYIRGENVTVTGSASRWIIGFAEGNNQSFFVYDERSTSFIPWRAGLPTKEVKINTILMPEKVFSQQNSAIMNLKDSETGKIPELVISNDVYVISTQSGGKIINLQIDAVTGKLIQSS